MRLLFLFSSIFILGINQNVYAQGHSLYCSHAQSTADTQKCLKRHLDSAQKRLNSVYQNFNGAVEGEALGTLKEIQNNWRLYRDAECSWESALSENPSLKRANELSCLANITESRANLLASALQGSEGAEVQKEFGNFPRWMNVVAKQAPKTTWDYNNRTRFDLDCDGDDEFIMTGVSFKKSEQPSLHTAIYHVAVSENPAIGKPSAKIFSFNINSEVSDNANGLCSLSLDINLISSNENLDGVCIAKLELKDKGCENRVIYWTGKEYALEKPVKILKTEENKKETKD